MNIYGCQRMEGVVKNKSKSSPKRKEVINSNSTKQNKDEQSTSTDCKSTNPSSSRRGEEKIGD
ncbi:hypothetical protein Scep_004454 [Stephania cephalantha]|uniref:Uncharacterized protein n=1 Tax=Stephania cephalantha TaxID=152367 RepID=A0AAP0KTE7_9MAGN